MKLTDEELAQVQATLERGRAYFSHDIDPDTEFCVHCGQSSEHIIDNRVRCFGQPGVTAISHLVRGGNLRRLISAIVPEGAP